MKKCPCCGYLTIDDSKEIITDICEVCFWQYDKVAHNKPDSIIGANDISLNQAKENFKIYGACQQKYINHVRRPFDDEV